MLNPMSDIEDKPVILDDTERAISDEISGKSGIPRPSSRSSSRPLSRPTPSARVRALGKEDLDEVGQNSADEDEEEEDEEEDEDEDQGIQVEGFFHKSFFAPSYRDQKPKHSKTSTTFNRQLQKYRLFRNITRGFKSDAMKKVWVDDVTLSDCSDGDEILHDSIFDMLEEERDMLYQELPYSNKRAYDPSDFEHLNVSKEIKELFQYITRYTPQNIELDHKLRPFIPEFIPAVGDIDAFIKVPRPGDEADKLGLIALDEPCAKQSDPTVLDLQLRAVSKETTYKAMAIKKLENADKKPKEIDAWINSIANLHRSKPPPTVNYSRNMPEIETLMQEWPPEMEELLNEGGVPTADLDCSLEEYANITCGLLDIPIYKSKIQSLHVLFNLYLEFQNSQHFKNLAMNSQMDNPLKKDDAGIDVDRLVIRE